MDTDSPGVTSTESPTEPQATPQLPTDRPVENVLAEFNRKFGQLKQQNEAIMAWIASQQQAAPAAQSQQAPPQDLTDDDLLERAQQGDKLALQAWTQRQAGRVYQQQSHQQNQQAIVSAQIQAIVGKYPVMADANHPLRQQADAFYRLYLQQGWHPGPATALEAMKTAITDNPAIVADLHTGSNARDTSRRSAAYAAQLGQTGVSHRQAPAPSSNGGNVRISPQQAAIAKRMGVKDPSRAIKNFVKRQDEGISSIGSVGNNPEVIAQMQDLDR